MSFINELKRRNVIRVGIAYAVIAWLIMQFSDVVLNNIEAPHWVFQVIMLMLGIGFPLVLIFAWAFEMTPEGLKKEKDVDRSQSITPHTAKKLNSTILVLMALAITYLLFDKFSEDGPDPVSEQSEVVRAEAPQQQMDATPETPIISRQSIAVLPFDNRSRNVDDEYFTEGIHDDLLTNLARIASLKVISRTSVTQYKDTEKTIPQIAEELGVATVMEGAVQRSGDTVRINVQLIDANTDEHLWAEIFDRELTAENLFAIQSEISQKIADALEATLSPEETQRLNDFPTQSMEAYNAYLRGRQLLPQRNAKDLGMAMKSFEEAVKLDPEFALAWVGIAESASLLEAHGTLNPDIQLQITQTAVDRALQIDPNLGEAYVSKGGLLNDLDQREQSEAAYKRAIELSPNYVTAYHWYSILIGNTNDRLQESLALLVKAEQLDPLSAVIKQNIAFTYASMGRFAEAESMYKQLLAANPEFSSGMVTMSWGLYGNPLGRLDEAIVMVQNANRVDPGKISSLIVEYTFWLGLGDHQKAQLVYQQMEALDAGNRWLPAAKAWSNIQQGRYAAAKEEGLFLGRNFNSLNVQEMAMGILARSGNYDNARQTLLKVEPRWFDPGQWSNVLNEGTNDACWIGLTLIRTGDEQLGRDLLGYAANYWEQTAPLYILHADRYPSFECHAYLGEVEKSLDALEISLNHQHVLSNWLFIAANPELRMLREHPRFAAMDEKARAELRRQREHLAQLEAETGP